MSTLNPVNAPSLQEVARWSAEEVLEVVSDVSALRQRNAELQHNIESLKEQIDWFRRQIFGPKSEKRIVDADPSQLHLGQFLQVPDQAPAPAERDVPAHKRRAPRSNFSEGAKDESNLFFDEARVPVKVIELANPEIEGLAPDQYEVIGEKVSHRLAQQPGSYVVLKYVRPVIKRRDTQTLSCPPAPQGVIEGSRADVSLIAGMLIDKMQSRKYSSSRPSVAVVSAFRRLTAGRMAIPCRSSASATVVKYTFPPVLRYRPFASLLASS